MIGAPRCAWIREAVALEKLEINDPRYVDRVYLAAIDGTPTATQRQQAIQMARTQSGCGLVWESQARTLAVHWPLLWKFYGARVINARENTISAARDFAKKCGAWVDALAWRRGRGFPKEGDALHIGGTDPAWVRGEIASDHVMTVVAWAGELLHTIDGGQPGIRLRTRALVEVWTRPDSGELWAAQVDRSTGLPDLDASGRPRRGRRVAGWIDPTRLPYLSPPRCLIGEASDPAYPDERPTGRLSGGRLRPRAPGGRPPAGLPAAPDPGRRLLALLVELDGRAIGRLATVLIFLGGRGGRWRGPGALHGSILLFPV